MAIKESDIVICGHGSGTPSTKNMLSYLSTRYNSLAPNGKHKGIVKVMRLKALTDSGRKNFHDTYATILGRNNYNQSLRSYVYKTYNGKYYSDCSSSGCATFQRIGYNIPLLNTAGIYQSNLFEEVPVIIKSGHITNPDVLKVGDCLLFVGSDPSRPLQIGHVEYIYEIKNTTTTTSNTTSNSTYTKTQFIKDVQKAIGVTVDGIAGTKTLNATVTVSKTKNNKHAVVLPIQKYLNSLGYDCGNPDGVAGTKFDVALKLYQKQWMSNPDGEATAKGTTWKKLLGLA